MVFETERLIIRDWRTDDAEAHFEIYGDPELYRYLGGNPTPRVSVEDSRERLGVIAEKHRELEAEGLGYWAVVEKETGLPVGSVLMVMLPPDKTEVEIGWHLGRAARGKGYATEAAQEILRYGFGQGREIIHAVTFPENAPSIRVTQRLGMKHLGRTTKYYELELELFAIENPLASG